MTDQPMKSIGLKFVGATDRPAETLSIQPGTTVRDVLQSVGLGTHFSLSDPAKPEAVFHASDNLYARINDGDMLACSSVLDAGQELG